MNDIMLDKKEIATFSRKKNQVHQKVIQKKYFDMKDGFDKWT